MWPESQIGKPVRKRSGKPFKSGEKTAVPINIINHPHTGGPAFVFDDGTFVSTQVCDPVREEKNEEG